MIPIISSTRRKRGTVYNFIQANGALAGWDFTNSAWTVSSNKALSTPTLGAELFANGTFASDVSWTKGTGWTISGGTGNHAAAAAAGISQAVATVGDWYKVVWDLPVCSGSFVHVNPGNNVAGVIPVNYTAPATGLITTCRQLTNTSLGFRANTNAVVNVDNASAKKITLADMFATKSGIKTTATLSVNVSITNDTNAGVVGWLDSHTSPANFVMAYYNRDYFRVVKCVAGVYTALISVNTGITYQDGGKITLRGVLSGANLLLTAFYNGVQVGTQQTVSDAGIISNTRHGMFSTYASNLFTNFGIA